MSEPLNGTCDEVRCPCHSKLVEAMKCVEAARKLYEYGSLANMEVLRDALRALDAVSTETGEKAC